MTFGDQADRLAGCYVYGSLTPHEGSVVLAGRAAHGVPACWRHRLDRDLATAILNPTGTEAAGD